jgi:endogenous inhibitor of DNA gyrase (YacG/DUF329 family)
MATVKCPNCGATVPWTSASPYRPFCSQRCKLIDLGDWLTGTNHIPGTELGEEPITHLNDGPKPANEDD